MAPPATDEAAAPFVWGSGGVHLTPEQIASRRKVAEAMMQEAGDYSPIRSVWQGVARAAKGIVGGIQARDANEAEKANAALDQKIRAEMLAGGGASPAPVSQADVSAPATVSAAPPAADTSDKVYRNDEPSPLDPPSGTDRTRMIATILGEAGNEPQIGKNAVASVIRTRAVDGGYGGDTPSAVVTAPNQFEPWNTPAGRARMAAAAADPRQAAAADAAIASAYGEGGKAPEDPTEGMTHFYSPAGQAAMGRSAPAWAGGESVTIGGHVFNSPDDAAGAKPAQVASADPAAIPANAAPAQGYAIPGQPAAAVSPAVAKVSGALAGVNPAVLAAMTSPYASESTKKIAGLLLAQQMTPKDVHTQETDAKGNIWDVNKLTGQRTVALKTDAETPKFTSYKTPDGVEVPGFVSDGKFTPLNQPTANSAGSTANLTGQTFLDAIEPGRAATIKAMVEGRLTPPTGAALRSDKVAKLLQDATQYEPGFDAAKWTQRNATSRDFASGGKSGQNVASLNTVMGHIGDLAEKGSALDNFDGVPMINTYLNDAKNAFNSGSGGDKTNNFNLARNAVADELSKVFKGAGISDHEIEQWKGTLNSSQSPTQLRGAVKTAMGLIESRLAALNTQRNNGMNTSLEPTSLLNDHSKETMGRVQKWIETGKMEPATAHAVTAAPVATPPAPAVAQLAQNPTPEMKAHFDEVFGAGAADRALGAVK